MNNENVKQQAFDAVLEKGVDFRITYLRSWLGKNLFPQGRKFVIYPLSFGTILNISKELQDIEEFEFKPENNLQMFSHAMEVFEKYKDHIVKAIAYAIINANKEPSKGIIKFLNANLTTKEAFQLWQLIVRQVNVSDFLSFMLLANRINLLTAKDDSISGESQEAS